MSLVILDASENDNDTVSRISTALQVILEEGRTKFICFKLREMKILPCRSCGACGLKTPGKCVISDEMHDVLKAIAAGSMLVMLTDIKFGGYSSQLKKAVDRFMVLGLPLYVVKQGNLLHPMRYGPIPLVVAGVSPENRQGQEESFKLLVARNALNMHSPYSKALVCKQWDGITNTVQDINDAVKEVYSGG